MDRLRDINLPWESRPTTVVVIGDLILDEYLDGSVNRISPEAPVPVHVVRDSSITAGGAANVARNLQLVGGHCSLVGVCGNDGAADQLKQILKGDGIDTSCIHTDFDRPTVRKTRITANHQQLVRIDWEETKPIHDHIQQELLSHLTRLDFDALIVSDYGKGGLPQALLGEVMSLGRSRSIPVVVDPKGKDYTGYRGAFLITPNYKEACEALGLDANLKWQPEQLAKDLKERYQVENVLVTLGADGMLGLSATNEFFSLNAVTREVFDVSGAGDTVVAIMALAMGSGSNLGDAMKLANIAAGCVVEKWGTQPILKRELLEALTEASTPSFGWRSTSRKILGRAKLVEVLHEQKAKNRRVVFTNGCFDLLHAGHISYLEEARALGQILVIGVNTDASVRRLKGLSRPIIPAEQRMRLLSALECVDYVVPFHEETPEQLIKALIPDVLVKGADYEVNEIVGADTVLQAGGIVERLPYVAGLSTSDIVRRVRLGKGTAIPESN